MALQKQVTLNSGVILENGYIKIRSLELYNNANYDSYVIIHVSIFYDQNARNSKKPEVVNFIHKVTGEIFDQFFSYNIMSQEGNNPISQGYLYLKTLPFYSDVIDIEDIKEI